MTDYRTVYKILLITLVSASMPVATSNICPVMKCGFVLEKPGTGAFSAPVTQEKSLMYIRTNPDDSTVKQLSPPADIDPSRIYYVTDPAASFCHAPLHPLVNSVPHCEIYPFLIQPSMVPWASSLTESGQSPTPLPADWFLVAAQGLDGQLVMSAIMRAPSGTKEPQVIHSISSRTASVRARLGEQVMLDCSFWVDPSTPFFGSGFSVEWWYQFRGVGRLVLAYDGKNDRLANTTETGAVLDFSALHETGNASLILEKAQVRHSGTYICSLPAIPPGTGGTSPGSSRTPFPLHPSLPAPSHCAGAGCVGTV